MIDPALFEELYREYRNYVFQVCYRIVRDAEIAQDLCHDVFIQVERNYDRFKQDSTFRTWIFRIAVNQSLMYFRKRSTRNELLTGIGHISDTELLPHHHGSLSHIGDRIALDDALKLLAKGYRKVVWLHDVMGYEHEEIAKILGISAGTSKSQLHKARSAMRKLLNKVA